MMVRMMLVMMFMMIIVTMVMIMMIAEGDDNVNYKDDHADQLWW